MHAVSVRSYSRNSGSTALLIVTGKPGCSRSTMSAISCSWRPSTYELISEIVSDSTPESTSSPITRSTCS